MMRERGQTLGLLGIGMMTALAASSSGMPPAAAPRPEPPVPTRPQQVVTTVVLPITPPRALPVVPSSPTPEVPPKRPVASMEVEITEPVATVSRFEGRYIGGNRDRALLYVQTDDDRAEIQSRPFAQAIPPADTDPKNDVRRIAVPVGTPVWHNGRVFLTTKRELLAVDPACCIDWKFVLPGKPDNGEVLLGIVGFYEDKVVLTSQHENRHGGTDKSTGRVLTFETTTGRQLGFTTIKGGFDTGAKLSLDARNGTLFSVTSKRYRIYELATGEVRWTAPLPYRSAGWAVSEGIVFATTHLGVGMPGRGSSGFELLARGAADTAQALYVASDTLSGRAYLPLVSSDGQFDLMTYEVRQGGSSLQWWATVPKRITTVPLVYGKSVYFATGNVLYRVNTANGAVCWKLTAALNPNEVLTDLAFVNGELHATGSGILVRVANRPEPRPVFFFGHFGGVGH